MIGSCKSCALAAASWILLPGNVMVASAAPPMTWAADCCLVLEYELVRGLLQTVKLTVYFPTPSLVLTRVWRAPTLVVFVSFLPSYFFRGSDTHLS